MLEVLKTSNSHFTSNSVAGISKYYRHSEKYSIQPMPSALLANSHFTSTALLEQAPLSCQPLGSSFQLPGTGGGEEQDDL